MFKYHLQSTTTEVMDVSAYITISMSLKSAAKLLLVLKKQRSPVMPIQKVFDWGIKCSYKDHSTSLRSLTEPQASRTASMIFHFAKTYLCVVQRQFNTLTVVSQRSKAKSYITSGLSEPWSLNQFKSLRARSSYENDAEHDPANQISRPAKLVHNSCFISNTYST